MSGFQVGFVHSALPLVVAAANGPIASFHLSILLNPSILLSRGYLLHLNPQKCPAASESILFK